MIYSTIYVALASPDIDRLTTFYAALLQHQPVVWRPGRYAEFQLSGLRLALFTPRDDHRQEFQALNGGPISLCIEVNPLESAITHLTQLGYPPPGSILAAAHGREIYAYDPDGNRLILYDCADRPEKMGFE